MKKLNFLIISVLLVCLTGVLNAQNWDQIGSDILGEAANDQAGMSVAISTDECFYAHGKKYPYCVYVWNTKVVRRCSG